MPQVGNKNIDAAICAIQSRMHFSMSRVHWKHSPEFFCTCVEEGAKKKAGAGGAY